LSPTVVTEDGIVMAEREEQRKKAPFPIVVTEGGIVITESEAQYWKARLLMVVTSEAMMILVTFRGTSLLPSYRNGSVIVLPLFCIVRQR